MILIGKSVNDMADLWIHDYNDEFGVHYGTDTSMWTGITKDDHDTVKFNWSKTTQKLQANGVWAGTLDQQSYVWPKGDRGETFNEAKERYKSSSFYNGGNGGALAHQHPIIAVFFGDTYIWPSRSVKRGDEVIKYTFKDYKNQDKSGTPITSSDRIKSIPKSGGDFLIYIDSNENVKEYKCQYYFSINNPFVTIENPTPNVDGQILIHDYEVNGTTYQTDGTKLESCICWEYEVGTIINGDVTIHNVLKNVRSSSDNTVDSVLHVKVEENRTPFNRSATILINKQYDQYLGMYVGPIYGTGTDTIQYTINQPADNIDFSTSKVIFYDNDNTNAKPIGNECYGPMVSTGGIGWIYFKVTGTSGLGATRIFGEYDNQSSNRINCTDKNGFITKFGTPTFNGHTGIWTVEVEFAANGAGTTPSYLGEITVTKSSNDCANYTNGSTVQLNVSGVSPVNTNVGAARNASIFVQISSSITSDNPPYSGAPSGECCYSQNAAVVNEPMPATYSFSIISGDGASVNQNGLVTWSANDGDSNRTVTVRVTCNETGTYKDVEVCQSASNYEIDCIKFYTGIDGLTETTQYGPAKGDGSEQGTIYFKILAKNGNGTIKAITDPTIISNITSSTCYPLFSGKDNTLTITGDVFSCKVKFDNNTGSDSYVAGNLQMSIPEASCTDETVNIILSGLSISNNGSVNASSKTHEITVSTTSKSASCNYSQDPGASGAGISELTYTFSLSKNAGKYIDLNKQPTNVNRTITWYANDTKTDRGGVNDPNAFSVTATCVQDTSYTVEVYPTQKHCYEPPKETVLESVEWTTISFYDASYSKLLQSITAPIDTNWYTIPTFSADGEQKTLYFKIFGTAKYSDNSTLEVTYGATTDFATPIDMLHATLSPGYERTTISNIQGNADKLKLTVVATKAVDEQNEKTLSWIKIYLDSNANPAWKAVKWGKAGSSDEGETIEIKQEKYNPAKPEVYTYEIEWDYIKVSRNSDMSMSSTYYLNNPKQIEWTLPSTDVIDTVYYSIYGTKYKKTSAGVVYSTEEIDYPLTSGYNYLTVSGNDDISFSKGPKYSNNVYKATVNGTNTDSAVSGEMSVTVADGWTDGDYKVNSANFDKFLKITKSAGEVYETETTYNWEYVVFYNSSGTVLTSKYNNGSTEYIDSILGSATSYRTYFNIFGTKTIHYSDGTSTETKDYKYTGSAADISLNISINEGAHEKYQVLQTGVKTISGSKYYYFDISNITNDSNSNHTAIQINCNTCSSDTSVINSLTVSQGAKSSSVCTFKWYIPTDTDVTTYSLNKTYCDNTWDEVWNPLGKTKGKEYDISDLTSSVPKTTKTYCLLFKSYLMNFVDGNQSNTASIVTCDKLDVTYIKNYVYSVIIPKGGENNVTYSFKNECSGNDWSMFFTSEGYNPEATYKIEWNRVIWGENLNDNSTEDEISKHVVTSSYYHTINVENSDQTEFKYRFRVEGLKYKYLDGVKQPDPETVYLHDKSYIIADTYDLLLDEDIYDVVGCNSTFLIKGSELFKENVSHDQDTNSRYCTLSISISANNVTNGWDAVNHLSEEFKVVQNGNTWDPIIEW